MKMRSSALSRHAIRLWQHAASSVDSLFAGYVDVRVYGVLRVGLTTIFLVRHADWLRPWLSLEHHRFVHGLLFLDSSASPPALESPIIPGLWLSDGLRRALVYARTLFASALLFGIRARACAALTFFAGYAVFAADRFRYYHHLQLLYVAIAWLSLAPCGETLSLEAALRRRFYDRAPARTLAEIWPLQLARALTISVYLAAAISKLDAHFLRGDALSRLQYFGVLSGPIWLRLRELFGLSGVAMLSFSTELALPVLLALRPTRRVGVIFGVGFHALISASMPVFSFGAQMSVLLTAFWPRKRSLSG